MQEPIRILIVEDLPTDTELAEREIKKTLSACIFQQVETRETYLHALDVFQPDLIVSDYHMPLFDGLTALQLALERPFFIPVIIFTSAINEDTAVACMKAGATDYVIKEHRKRLGQAVIHALEEKRLREEQQKAAAALRESEESLRQQNYYLTALHETALSLLNRLDLDPILESIVTRTAELVGARHGFINLVLPNEVEMEARFGYGIYSQSIGTRIRIGEGMTGRVWSTGQPMMVNNYQTWPGHLPRFAQNGVQAVLAAPLKVDQHVIGVLGLSLLESEGSFNAGQLELIVRFAGLASIALDNAQLYQAAQNELAERKRAEQLQALQLTVTRMTAVSRSRAAAIPRLLEAICVSEGWAVGELWRVDTDTDQLHWEAAWHRPLAQVAAFVEAGTHSSLSRGSDVAGEAWAGDRLIWRERIASDTAFSRAKQAAAAQLHSAIALPISANGVLAVLVFYHDHLPSPAPDLCIALESIVSQIGQFFERMRAEAQLRQYAQQLTMAQEQERSRIARELHDEIGQALALIKMNVRAVQRLTQTSELSPRLGQSLGIIEETLQRVRRLALDLRPSMLDDLGLASTLQWYLERQAEWAGWKAEVLSSLESIRLSRDLETACFRVAQEALNNIARHAQAQEVLVKLWRDSEWLHMQIQDDGVGFELRSALERAIRGGSAGLLGMRERVELAGGQMAIESSPGMGTTIQVHLPLVHIPLS